MFISFIQQMGKNPAGRRGFTLVESLVAITILLVGVLGPMTAATRGISDGYYAGNNLTGTYLAQEGLEFLTARVRDNFTSDKSFLDGLADCLDPGICALVYDSDSDNFSFPACASANNCQVAFNDVNGFFEPYDPMSSSFSGTVFTRTLQVFELEVERQALLRSRVGWSNQGIWKEFELSVYVNK